MRIVCPSCFAAYEVPALLMTPQRTVRCARCGCDWIPAPSASAAPSDMEAAPKADPATAEIPPLEAPDPREPPRSAPISLGDDVQPPAETVSRSAMARLVANPAMLRSSTALRLAWAGSIVLLLLLLAVAFAWRSQIVAVWPASSRAYAAFGLHPEEAPRE